MLESGEKRLTEVLMYEIGSCHKKRHSTEQGGASMKLKSLGLIVASVVFTSVFYGCATETGRTRDALTVGNGHSPNNQCQWHFNKDPSQKNKVTGPIVLDVNTGGACSVDPPSTSLFIGNTPGQGMRVRDIDGIEFKLEGSCKYCYTNTSGGMSCVTYPGPPC
jgi:hypothetical protein